MITQISKLEVGRVNFYAMVDTVRDKKNMQFIVAKDFSGKIQLFIDKVKYPEIGELFLRLVPGATVRVQGELVKSEYVKMGGQEVLVDGAELTSHAEPNPIADDSTIDYRLNYRCHLNHNRRQRTQLGCALTPTLCNISLAHNICYKGLGTYQTKKSHPRTRCNR